MKNVFSFLGKLIIYGSAFVTILGFFLAFVFPNKFGNLVDVIRGSGAQITEAVEDASEEITDAIGSTTEAASGAKREISDDPIKELVNRGYDFDHYGFMRAIGTGDRTSVDLFCNSGGGRFVETHSGLFVPTQKTRMSIQEDVWESYLECPIVDFQTMCDRSAYRNAFVCRTNFDDESFALVCGRDRLDELRSEIQQIVKGATHADDVRYWKQYCGREQVEAWRG